MILGELLGCKGEDSQDLDYNPVLRSGCCQTSGIQGKGCSKGLGCSMNLWHRGPENNYLRPITQECRHRQCPVEHQGREGEANMLWALAHAWELTLPQGLAQLASPHWHWRRRLYISCRSSGPLHLQEGECHFLKQNVEHHDPAGTGFVHLLKYAIAYVFTA
jgi:hypothetical protein